jgi:hypothetical protein
MLPIATAPMSSAITKICFCMRHAASSGLNPGQAGGRIALEH